MNKVLDLITKIRQRLEPKKKVILISVLIIATVLGGFYFLKKKEAPEIGRPDYIQGYRLVNEKISQSAAVIINLPPDVDKSTAQQNTKFYPEIKGEWLEIERENEIAFKPREKLELNRYYSVQLTMSQSEETVMKADFLVVEDPKIITIFPRENSEAPEDSEITIVFNRPMVPLTTIGEIEGMDIPVEITPQTEGKFRWTTTRNLQFIPNERLVRSSNYKVKIKSGLVSMDNLRIEAFESQFFTRKLRYSNIPRGNLAYNQPISIYFNQPVDLERTKQEVSLRNTITGKNVPFIIEYATEERYVESKEEKGGFLGKINITKFLAQISDKLGLKWFSTEEDKDKEVEVNKSVLRIYNEKDRFGRERLWDFENKYSLEIKKAYPLEGDIILNQTRLSGFTISGVIKNMRAESERTNYAALEFFDPQGKLWVNFYEDIDLSKTRIIAQKSKSVDYGEKCKDEAEKISRGVECEKIPDKSKISITFKEGEVELGEKLEINFEKIVNTTGLVINQEPIRRYIISYPELKITKTSPESNSSGAKVTELILCSNSPLSAPAKEDYKDYFSADKDYEINSWGNSWKITRYSSYYKCSKGEFATRIYYGLMPWTDYSLTLQLEDVFSQKIPYSLSFSTGEIPHYNLSFYHLQKSYNVTSPQKTKLTYAVRNMTYVIFEICKIDASDFLYYIDERPGYNKPPYTVTNCKQTNRGTLNLPDRYWIKNYFTFDIKEYFKEPIGHYIITFYHPDYYRERWRAGKEQIYERTYLTVTNLAVGEKRINPLTANYGRNEALTTEQLKKLRNLYWVSDLNTLEPVKGAIVGLYSKSGKGLSLVPGGIFVTDGQGIALTNVVSGLQGAVISKGIDSTIIPMSESRLDRASDASSAKKIYLYTDKPIYRPTHEVFIKGIHRIGYDGSYEIYRDRRVNLKIYNSKNDEIFNEYLEINDFGTFNAKFVLSNESPLGMYRVCADQYSCIYFDVQEYVPAPFEVKVKSDKEEYISKDSVNLEIEANYYFGVPLEGGEVTYTISSQNYYFDRYTDGYFNFGSRWYYWSPYSYGDKFILRDKVSLGSDGKANISQLIDFEQLFKDREERKSKIIVVDVTVKNPQGQSVSEQKSFIVHAGLFYLGIKPDKSFFPRNESIGLKIKTVNTQGKGMSLRDIDLRLYEISWDYNKRLGPDGGYHYKWEKQRKLVTDYDNFSTNRNGDFSREIKIGKEGIYELEASAADEIGNLVWASYQIYVFGEGRVSVRPTENTELEIEVEKINLSVGEEAKMVIKSPYQEAKALISIERGKIFSYQIREIKGNLYNYNFKIEEEYIPNVYASVLLLSSEPEIKFGKVEFQVNTDTREIEIGVNSNKTHYLPGEEVTLDITARDFRGQPVSAELSVSVVDLSVLALKGNPKKNPLIFFYGGFPLTVSTASNIKNILVETPIPTKGGGGMAEEALARKKRGLFKETAFWEAVVTTDEKGKAQVKFTLPDNLTTWQTEALGLTKDTRLGVAYHEFLTKKELMVTPLKPRFVVPGDNFYIGAKVFNQSKGPQFLTVQFESQTLVSKDNKPERKLLLLSGKTKTIYFEVEAPSHIQSGKHKFIISAKGQSLEDTVENSINITGDYTYEVTATSNYSSDAVVREYVFLPDNIVRDKGNLSIKTSATLAVFLSDSLNYLLVYPYGCSEQIASRLDGIAIVQKGLNLPNISEKFNLGKIIYRGQEYSIPELVEIGLSELYNNQQRNGGFSYWRGGKSDFHLTLHVVDTLYNLSLAGFDINQNSLKRATNYLYKNITTNRDLYKDNNTVILAAYTLLKLPDFTGNNVLRDKIIKIANDNSFIQDRISNTSLSYLAILLSEGGFSPQLKDKIYNTLDNRIDIDARGAFLERGKNVIWRYYETSIKNTALYLKALVADKRENPILEKVLRWILNSRAKDGAWGSTNNTVNAIDALADFLEWKRETESNFTLELLVNEEDKGSFDFKPETIFDQFRRDVSIEDLEFNKNNTISFLKTNHNDLPNNFYYDLALKYYLPANQIPPRDEGFSIVRELYRVDDKENKNPLREAKVGDVLRVHLQFTVPERSNFLIIEDYIPAGFEIVNLDLATEEKSLRLQEKELEGREFRPDFKEMHDDRVFLYKESVYPNVYEFDYYVRALIKGKFVHLPSHISEMYFPENFGRNAGDYFEIR